MSSLDHARCLLEERLREHVRDTTPGSRGQNKGNRINWVLVRSLVAAEDGITEVERVLSPTTDPEGEVG